MLDNPIDDMTWIFDPPASRLAKEVAMGTTIAKILLGHLVPCSMMFIDMRGGYIAEVWRDPKSVRIWYYQPIDRETKKRWGELIGPFSTVSYLIDHAQGRTTEVK